MLSWLDSRALRIDTVSPDPVRRLAALLAANRADAEVSRSPEAVDLAKSKGWRS